MREVQFYMIVCIFLYYQIILTNGFTVPFSSFSSKVVPRRPSNSTVAAVKRLPKVCNVETIKSSCDFSNLVKKDKEYGVYSNYDTIGAPTRFIPSVPNTSLPLSSINIPSTIEPTCKTDYPIPLSSDGIALSLAPCSRNTLTPPIGLSCLNNANVVIPNTPRNTPVLSKTIPSQGFEYYTNVDQFLRDFNSSGYSMSCLPKVVSTSANILPVLDLNGASPCTTTTQANFRRESVKPSEEIVQLSKLNANSMKVSPICPLTHSSHLSKPFDIGASFPNELSLSNLVSSGQDVNFPKDYSSSLNPCLLPNNLDPTLSILPNPLLIQPSSSISNSNLSANSCQKTTDSKNKIKPQSLNLKIMPITPSADSKPLQGLVRPLIRNKTLSNTCSSPKHQSSSIASILAPNQLPLSCLSSSPDVSPIPILQPSASSSIKQASIQQSLSNLMPQVPAAQPCHDRNPSRPKKQNLDPYISVQSANLPTNVNSLSPFGFPLIQELSAPNNLQTPVLSTPLNAPTSTNTPISVQPIINSNCFTTLTPRLTNTIPSSTFYNTSVPVEKNTQSTYLESCLLNTATKSNVPPLALNYKDYPPTQFTDFSFLNNLPPVELSSLNALSSLPVTYDLLTVPSSFKNTPDSNSLVSSPASSEISPGTPNLNSLKHTVDSRLFIPKSLPSILPSPSSSSLPIPSSNTVPKIPALSELNIPINNLASLIQNPFKKMTSILDMPPVISLPTTTICGKTTNLAPSLLVNYSPSCSSSYAESELIDLTLNVGTSPVNNRLPDNLNIPPLDNNNPVLATLPSSVSSLSPYSDTEVLNQKVSQLNSPTIIENALSDSCANKSSIKLPNTPPSLKVYDLSSNGSQVNFVPFLYTETYYPQIPSVPFYEEILTVPIINNQLSETFFDPSLTCLSSSVDTLPEVIFLSPTSPSSFTYTSPITSIENSLLAPIAFPCIPSNSLKTSSKGINYIPIQEIYIPQPPLELQNYAPITEVCSNPKTSTKVPITVAQNDVLVNSVPITPLTSFVGSNSCFYPETPVSSRLSLSPTTTSPISLPSAPPAPSDLSPCSPNVASKLTNTILVSALSNLTTSNAKKFVPLVDNIPIVSLPQVNSLAKRKSKVKRCRKNSSRSKSKNSHRISMVTSSSEPKPTFVEPLSTANASSTPPSSSSLLVSLSSSTVTSVDDDLTSSSSNHIEPIDEAIVSSNSVKTPRSLPSPSITLSSPSPSSKSSSSDLKTAEELVEFIILKELVDSDTNCNWDLLEKIINVLCKEE